MAGTITTIVKAIFQSQGAEKVTSDLQKVGQAGEEISKKQTRLGNESTNTGRAFASQASGLGGLVAAYAGAAATTFALQQAFSALKSAADFQQIISGTNALAASFGQSGSQILNNIQEITKGQLSLKEAAAAANLALSAGFSPNQINKLSEVATKASRTLGRDLTDSYNRLVRGAAKLEPELLDELGIFTRIEPAIEAYAAKTGKAASSLTNFERRQAFVNAIIDEGSRKYSEISLSTDTSSEALNRLAARIVDVGNKLGGILTDFLAPIANFFGKDLGNSVLIFLGILTLALSKGRSLLEVFFNNLADKALATGARVSSALTGPAFTTNIEKAGEALKGIGVGLTKAEMATVNAIKGGAVQPQQIQARIDELKALQERQQNRQFNLGLGGKALDQSIAKANAAAIAIRELEEAQKKASSSSIIAGSTFEKLGAGLSRFATGVSTALGYFNLFLAALGAAQLIGQVFGVDILGAITNFFTRLQEESKAAREAVNSLVTEVSKSNLSVLRFRYKKEDVEAAGKNVAETLQEIASRQGPLAGTFQQRLQRALIERQNRPAFLEIGESGRAKRAVEIQLLKDLVSIKPSAELVKILTSAPEEIGGQALDFVKLFTSGNLVEGGVKFAGVVSDILYKGKEIDKYTGKVAGGIALGIVEIKKFNEEQANGLLTAESASQRSIALSERLKQIEIDVVEARIKAAKEDKGDSELKIRTKQQLEILSIQQQALKSERDRIDLLATELAQRDRIRKSIQTTFSSQIKFIENLPTSGLFNPDNTISRSQEETQRNQIVFLGKEATSLSNRLSAEQDILNLSSRNRQEVENRVTAISKELLLQKDSAALLDELSTTQADLIKAKEIENISSNKVNDLNVRLKEILEAQLGFLYEAGKQAFQLATQEEKRTLQYQKQLDSLKSQYEQLVIQNKINLTQAQGEAAQRAGQAQVRLLEARINYQKELEKAVEATAKAQQAELEIQKNQVERTLQLAESQRELAKARFELTTARTLAPLQLQQETLGRTPNLVAQETLLKLEQQIADVNYNRELGLIQERKVAAEQEFNTTLKKIDIQKQDTEIQLATLSGRQVLVENQRRFEDEAIKKRDALDRQKLQNELAVLKLQDDLAKSKSRADLDIAFDNKLQRDFELDIISKQLDLLEQQKEVFKTFLLKYEELIRRQQGDSQSPTAENIFKNFEQDLEKAKKALITNRGLSEQIYNQETKTIIERVKGELEVNKARAGGASAELARLVEIQKQTEETTALARAAEDQNRETEAKTLRDKLEGLKAESKIASDRYNTAIAQAAKDELIATQAYASKLQEIADQRNTVKQLFEDISKGIKENLSTAVLDFFKAINSGIPTIQAFRQGMQKLGISVLETIQTAIAKKFIIEPLQNLVGQGIGALYSAITGDQLAKTGDQILQSVFTGSALRVTMEGVTPGAPAPGQGGTTGFQPGDPQGPQVAAQAQQKAAEASEGFGDKLKTLGVNFQTVGAVAIGTFGAVLAATGNWKKAFLATILTTFSTMITQIIMKSSLAGVGSAFSAAGSGISGFFGNLFGSGASAASNNPLVNPELSPQIAIGGPVRHMAAGGYAGLRDRVPALLEPGEFVIRRPAAMAIGGQTLNQMNATGQTGPGNVTVNMSNQGTPQEVIGTPKVSMNGRDMIVDIVVKDIQNNGPIRKTLRGGM